MVYFGEPASSGPAIRMCSMLMKDNSSGFPREKTVVKRGVRRTPTYESSNVILCGCVCKYSTPSDESKASSLKNGFI